MKMARRGFVATRAQYEHKFRQWGIQKYKKAGRTRQPRREAVGPHEEAESVSTHPHNLNQAEDFHMTGVESDMNILSDENDVAAATMAQSMEAHGVASIHNVRSYEEEIIVDLSLVDVMDMINFDLPPPEPDDMNLAESNLRPLAFDNLGFMNSPEFNVSLPVAHHRVYRKLLAPSPSNTSSRTNDSNFIYKFSNIVTEIASSNRMGDIPVPHRLYSSETFAGEDWSQLSDIPDTMACEARFDGRLLSSIINGFDGLSNIPHVAVLEFLQRHPAMQRELFKRFDTQSSPVVKAFAEKVFQTCVESDNIHVVRFLINKDLVNANEAVCHFEGEVYTPLQSAAIHQSFRVVKHLISLVDINKSLSRASQANALELLIRYMDYRRSTISEGFIQLVDEFLKERATVSVELVVMVLTRFVDEQLIGRILGNLAGQKLHTLLSQKNLFRNMIRRHTAHDLMKIIKLVNDYCRKLGGDSYLHQFRQQVDKVFHEFLRRGDDELVRTMLLHTSSSHKALQIANEAKNEAAIRIIQEENPYLKTELALEGDTENSDTIIFALESKDQNLLRGLEERGVFDRLRGHKLGQVLAKALHEGNKEYADKILDLNHDFNFYDASTVNLPKDREFSLPTVFGSALAQNFHDIAWKLLSIGLVTEHRPRYDQSSIALLHVAVMAKQPDFVEAIIGWGFDGNLFNLHVKPVLEWAIESGLDSIFDALWKVRPTPFYPTRHLLGVALKKGHESLFFDMIKPSPKGRYYLQVGLSVAVECGAEQLFDKLISLGARVDDDNILAKAIRSYPLMVKPLLDRYWKAYPQGRAGYGHSIIKEALPSSCPIGDGRLSLDEVIYLNLLNPNHLLQEHPRQETLLVKAIETRDCAIVKKFIAAGSNVNSIMDRGRCGEPYYEDRRWSTTALLTAIETESKEMVELLLSHNANVNEPAQLGIERTPLQKAAEMNNSSIVDLLLKYGADVNARPAMFNGGTALQFAAIHGNCDIASSLIMFEARADIPPPRGVYGRWPLEGAAENGRFDMIALLWNTFGPFPEEQCQRAMWRAERNGHFGCKEEIQELIAKSTTTNEISLLKAS
ncbi:hypothetical protein ONZ43_g3417 [Nemania bipapillata]|uniref:Uncharacterized protein n=1 Tax=Nemania bipapillata TaxID=110536 RepID=A0ACC2IWU9_9PEZI|nr:hypothetical protein ONZ43_g3417 [Nemania bipapillata]